MAETWAEVNQRYLASSLAALRGKLERHAAHVRGDAAEQQTGSTPEEAEGAPASSAIGALCAAFGLSAFERDILLMCAGIELDGGFAALCAAAQGDAQRAYPTFSLALAALPGAHWSALTPVAPLRRWRLIEVGPGSVLTTSPLRIDERILHFLAGVSHPDERLVGIVEPAAQEDELVPSHQAIADQIVAAWSRQEHGTRLPAIQLCGADPAANRAIAAAASAALGLGLNVLSAAALPSNLGELVILTRLLEREAALGGSALLIACEALDMADATRVGAAIELLEHAGGAVLVATIERIALSRRSTVALDVRKPSAEEQRALWQQALGETAGALSEPIDLLTAQFDLSARTIRAAAAEALGQTPSNSQAEIGRIVWEVCRSQARIRLDDLAQRIAPAANWDDLVLPEPQQRIIRTIATHVRRRTQVYDRWGFAAKGERGLGISALFAGASGTGKTMAAEVLANDLRLDLYRIDLSAVVSKYIGETEKNLRRVFDTAEEAGAILLFDEADALFGKRSEVKESHDRFANIEVGYLLQRMETYRGLAILTTNLKSALDTAFLRRIRFVIQFPFPDQAQRAEIWRRIFPATTPTEGLKAARLAQLNLAGGNIRNIAINAAFLAADHGTPVRMEHLLSAARSEYAKLERTLTEAETDGW